MTKGDSEQFAQLFQRMSLALPARVDTSDTDLGPVKMDVYFEAMGYIPWEDVERAGKRLLTHGSGFFPSTQEWSTLADQYAYERQQDEIMRARSLPAAPTVEEPGEGDDPWSRAKRARAKFLAKLRSMPAKKGLDWNQVADSFEKGVPCKPPWEPHCPHCDDSGFAKRTCSDDNKCPTHTFEMEVEEHEYLVPCGCAAFNPIIQRRQEARMHDRKGGK